MSLQKSSEPDLPGWTIITSQDDLEAHDPLSPAYLLIPAPLVRPIWEMLDRLTLPDTLGEWSRGLELLLVTSTEGDRKGMASALNQLQDAVESLHAIVHRFVPPQEGQLEIDIELPPILSIPMDDGETETKGHAGEVAERMANC